MIKIKMSDCLKERLKSIGNDKVSKLILKLTGDGIANKNVKKNHPDYLDFDGNLVTYINSNTVKINGIDKPWTVNTRQSTKMVRVLRRILKNNYVDEKLSAQEIENFVAKWNASLEDTYKIEVLRGFDILKAFNYDGDINLEKFQISCANFGQNIRGGYCEPKVKWFYFYIYNENVSVAVLRENGIIKARSVMFEGEQAETYGDFKKGEYYTFMNGFYSEGDSKYRAMLINWGRQRGYVIKNSNVATLNDVEMKGSFYTPIKTHYKTYAPVDTVYVDTEKDMLVTALYNRYGNPDGVKSEDNIRSCYKLKQGDGNHSGKNGGVINNKNPYRFKA